MENKFKALIVIILLLLPLSACDKDVSPVLRDNSDVMGDIHVSHVAAHEEDEYEIQRDNEIDPFEPVNRFFFHFNSIVDGILINPLANLYGDAVPYPAQEGIRNALHNLWSPVSMINSIAQGKIEDALETCARFIINSTIGLFGLFDVASEMGLEKHEEDFGQTLAVWGVGSGPYLVLPIIGPTNLRDAFGRGVDYFIDPFNYFSRVKWGDKYIYIRMVAHLLSARATHMQDIQTLKETSLDFYATVRSLYAQHRHDKISDGVGSFEEEGPEAFIHSESFFSSDNQS